MTVLYRKGAETRIPVVCAPLQAADILSLLPTSPLSFAKRSGQQVTAPGDADNTVICIVSGWAFSYRLFSDGRRQILSIHLPGNLIGLSSLSRDVAAWGCEAITDLSYASFCRDTLMAQASGRPEIALRITAEALRGEILLRERLADVARRSARERVANFLFEIYCRAHGRRQADAENLGALSIPVTQNIIADAVGLTPIHVSRTLRQFKINGIIRYVGHDLYITDAKKLREVSTFEDAYIQWLRRPVFAAQAAPRQVAVGKQSARAIDLAGV